MTAAHGREVDPERVEKVARAIAEARAAHVGCGFPCSCGWEAGFGQGWEDRLERHRLTEVARAAIAADTGEAGDYPPRECDHLPGAITRTSHLGPCVCDIMGVSIYPGGAQWAYSGFMHFRERLAESEGINLREMQGFGGERSWELPNGSPVTPLAPLLNHSDCEGYLDGYDCASVLPRLRFIVASWGADGSWDYDTEQASKLIEGMEHCAEHRCALVFS